MGQRFHNQEGELHEMLAWVVALLLERSKDGSPTHCLQWILVVPQQAGNYATTVCCEHADAPPDAASVWLPHLPFGVKNSLIVRG